VIPFAWDCWKQKEKDKKHVIPYFGSRKIENKMRSLEKKEKQQTRHT
jgi:hypothetical protein